MQGRWWILNWKKKEGNRLWLVEFDVNVVDEQFLLACNVQFERGNHFPSFARSSKSKIFGLISKKSILCMIKYLDKMNVDIWVWIIVNISRQDSDGPYIQSYFKFIKMFKNVIQNFILQIKLRPKTFMSWAKIRSICRK